MTKVVTFYSYKGGVGRTLALVNTAHVLAKDGYRVLMVDFDLEAPGMTHFFADRVRESVTPKSRDGLDLLLEAKRTLPEIEPQKRKWKRVALESYVIGIPLPEAWLETEMTGSPWRNGRLDLLPATLDPTEALNPEPSRGYLERMDALDLPGIFSSEGPRHRFGDHVRRYFTHARFTAPGDLLFTMREHVQAAYDIVLVDSRTGLNEISGLCVGPLSDALVICTGLNQQNVEGTRYFMQKAGLLGEQQSKPYALVVGPVPPWHTRVANERMSQISEMLNAAGASSVPYHPAAALTDKVFVVEDPDEDISTAYRELAPKVAALVEAKHPENGLWPELDDALATGSWIGYLRELGPWLSSIRIRRSQHKLDREPTLQQFASAVTIPMINAFKFLGALRDYDSDAIIAGASVAAARLKSNAPFERAWEVATRDQRRGQPRVDLAPHLAFMQLRVLRSMPSNTNLLAYMASASERATDHDRRTARSRFAINSLVTYAYAAELGLDVLTPEHRRTIKKIKPKEYRILAWTFDTYQLPTMVQSRSLDHTVWRAMNVLENAPSFAWIRLDWGDESPR